MPLPLAPLIPIALRLGLLTAVGYAVRRAVARRIHPGRTDIRAEDALDDLGEGLAIHRPRDLPGQRQTSTAGRLRRTIRIGGTSYDIDAGVIARFRVRKHPQ